MPTSTVVRSAYGDSSASLTSATVTSGTAGGPHRYWRLNITSTAGTYCSMAEIEMRSVAGGTDLTGSGTASASATTSGWPASQAVDNNTGTGWATYPGTPPQWWQYDFGAGNAYAIIELRITPRQDGFYSESPANFQFQYSDDGSTWTTQKAISGLAWTAAAQTIDVDAAAAPKTYATFTGQANGYLGRKYLAVSATGLERKADANNAYTGASAVYSSSSTSGGKVYATFTGRTNGNLRQRYFAVEAAATQQRIVMIV